MSALHSSPTQLASQTQRSSISALLSKAGIYTAGEFSRTIIPTLLLPILTYYLAPADYGVVVSFQALVAFIFPFIGLNTTRAATWRYFEYSREHMAIYVGNCLLIMLITTLLLTGFSFVAPETISDLTKIPSSWIWLVPVLCAAEFVSRLVLAYWRALERALQFSIFNIMLSATNMGLSLALVIALSMNWQGRVLGILLSNIGFAFAALFILYKSGYLRLLPRRREVEDAVSFSAPLIIQNLAAWTQQSSNRLFLNNMVGLTATGLYSVGITLASVISLIIGGFNNSWVPWLYERLKINDHGARVRIVRFTYLYFIVILLGVVVLAYIMPYIIKSVLDDRYITASDYIFWAALAFAFHGMQLMMEGYILFENRSALLAKLSLIVAILSLCANYTLILFNGAIGAAQAMALTYFTSFMLSWIAAHRVHPMPWLSAITSPLKSGPRVYTTLH